MNHREKSIVSGEERRLTIAVDGNVISGAIILPPEKSNNGKAFGRTLKKI